MNSAFQEEMEEMEHDEQTQQELEDCYYEDLDDNPYANKNTGQTEPDEFAEFLEDDDMEESVDEIFQNAQEADEVEEDPAEELFKAFKEGSEKEEEPDTADHVALTEFLNSKIEKETEKVQLMRKSNFALKSKIDILYDVLQTQKE